MTREGEITDEEWILEPFAFCGVGQTDSCGPSRVHVTLMTISAKEEMEGVERHTKGTCTNAQTSSAQDNSLWTLDNV